MSFVFFSFFPSPNLSRRRLDVCHTSTHGVALCEFKMQVWNLLHSARWKHRTQKSRQKSPSGHHGTILSGYIFATKARIDNRKKLVKQQCVIHMSPQYGERRPTSGWHRSGSLRHPCKFERVSRLGSITARHLVVGVSQTAALNRGRHLYSAGRRSRWALAHISSLFLLFNFYDE